MQFPNDSLMEISRLFCLKSSDPPGSLKAGGINNSTDTRIHSLRFHGVRVDIYHRSIAKNTIVLNNWTLLHLDRHTEMDFDANVLHTWHICVYANDMHVYAHIFIYIYVHVENVYLCVYMYLYI